MFSSSWFRWEIFNMSGHNPSLCLKAEWNKYALRTWTTCTFPFLRLHGHHPQNDSTTEYRRRQRLSREGQVGEVFFWFLFLNSKSLDSPTVGPWKLKRSHSKGEPHFTLLTLARDSWGCADNIRYSFVIINWQSILWTVTLPQPWEPMGLK